MFESIQIAATTGGWVWVTFVVAAALIVVSAMQLAKYGDVIAARTKLGGMFIGVLLLAGATASALASASEYAELVDDPKGEVWARVEEYGEEEGVRSEE